MYLFLITMVWIGLGQSVDGFGWLGSQLENVHMDNSERRCEHLA